VFVVGDAARGPETIVKGIASARRAVDAILAREGGMRAPAWPLPPENTEALRAARDRSIAASSHGADDDAVRAAESARCLGCRALCLKCVEVCPNRANTAVAVEGFRDAVQVVHLDALCNECGNCATFCPWDGKPYRDKPTVFAAEEDFRDSANPGFFVAGGAGLLRTAAGTFPLRVTGPAGTAEAAGADPRALAVVRAVVAAHPWLLGAGSDPQGGPA
jgi:putative selenate reductase